MAIAPFRIGSLQIPDNQPRAVPLDYRPLQDLGNTIGEYRSKQALAGILQQATDEKGNIDFNRAGSLLAQNGMTDRAREMLSIALQKEAGARAGAASGRAEQNQRFEQEAKRRELDLRERAINEGGIKEHVVTDPYTDETTIVRSNNRDPGQVIYRSGAPAARGKVPGPQSALEPDPGAPSSFNDRFAAATDDTGLPPTAQLVEGRIPIPAQTPGGTPNEPISTDEPAQREIRPSIKTLRDETAKKIVANQEDTIKSATAAADMLPLIREMKEAYKGLISTGGIGPVVGNQYTRPVQSVIGSVAGSVLPEGATPFKANEAARQRYDTALAAVKARITAAQMKGQGSVSNFERQLSGAQFPGLDAIDPANQLPFLDQLEKSTLATIGSAKGTPLANQPGVVLNRPEVERGAPSPKHFSPTNNKVPMDAAKMLLADPSPEARAEFDAVFGQGAARAVLKR